MTDHSSAVSVSSVTLWFVLFSRSLHVAASWPCPRCSSICRRRRRRAEGGRRLPQARTERYGKRQYADAIKDFSRCLELDPKNVEAFDRRGSAYFMVARFAESVSDFDNQIKLRPKMANEHWRRGIPLYYAGKYDEAPTVRRLRERVHRRRRERRVALHVRRQEGRAEEARTKILKIGKDGRTPMMEVYELFKGKLKPEDVMKAANEGKLSDDQRKPRLF